MASVLSISQLNKYVAFKLSSDVKLKGIAVKGEISNFVDHFKSGHLYFTLKDTQSQVKAVMFSKNAARLKFEPENGMSVMAIGNVELYERDGSYQIIVTELVPLGIGAVNERIEKLKRKLFDNGIIDEKNKKPIPLVPKKLAVVTSADAAALRDILNITARRYPLCKIEVFPTLVQGVNAEGSICNALEKADKSGADTIILTRGGGSVEDLMAFNSERVAVAVHDCKTPVVTAVGHETDTTIVDYVSDMRAPTPSAAAEICTPDKSELISAVKVLESRLNKSFEHIIDKKLALLQSRSSSLKALSPERKLEGLENELNTASRAMSYAMQRRLIRAEGRLSKSYAALEAMSPFGVLERGYSITTINGRVINDENDILAGESIEIRTKNMIIAAEVKNIKSIEE